tara:strand:+ start:18 stop:884 length:867 start_codon:yes stop_codon:yes gene_type:complete
MSKDFQKLLTIGITAYNEGDYLLEAWNSVVNQEDHRWQAIMVLDGRADKKTESNFDKIYHNNLHKIKLKENLGPYLTRTLAIEQSKTDWYCQLDGDDLLDKNYVNLVLECINSNHHAEIIYHNVKYIRGDNISIKKFDNYNYNQLPFFLNSHCPFNKKIFFELKGYSTKCKDAADRDFLIKCGLDNKRFVFIKNSILYTVRKRSNSVGAQRSASPSTRFFIAKYFHKKYSIYFIENNYYGQFFKEHLIPMIYYRFKNQQYIKFITMMIVLCYESKFHILKPFYNWCKK